MLRYFENRKKRVEFIKVTIDLYKLGLDLCVNKYSLETKSKEPL